MGAGKMTYSNIDARRTSLRVRQHFWPVIPFWRLPLATWQDMSNSGERGIAFSLHWARKVFCALLDVSVFD